MDRRVAQLTLRRAPSRLQPSTAVTASTVVAPVPSPRPSTDSPSGHFANDKRLSAAAVNTLVSWADNGAPEGDAKDKPAPIKFNDGWNIKPDMIIEMPQEIQLPAMGTINYKNILVKAHFAEDVWVEAAEMRPGNPAVVHHMRGIVRGPGSHWM